MARRNIPPTLRSLEAKGYLVLVRKGYKRSGKHSEYQLSVPVVNSSPADSKSVPGDTFKTDVKVSRSVLKVSPGTSKSVKCDTPSPIDLPRDLQQHHGGGVLASVASALASEEAIELAAALAGDVPSAGWNEPLMARQFDAVANQVGCEIKEIGAALLWYTKERPAGLMAPDDPKMTNLPGWIYRMLPEIVRRYRHRYDTPPAEEAAVVKPATATAAQVGEVWDLMVESGHYQKINYAEFIKQAKGWTIQQAQAQMQSVIARMERDGTTNGDG